MKRWPWITVSLLQSASVACGNAGIRAVDRGDEALLRGELDAASDAYQEAMSETGRGERTEDRARVDDWIDAKVVAGRARIAIERLRATLATVPRRGVEDLFKQRNWLRENGGDDALEQQLLAAMNARVAAELDALLHQPSHAAALAARKLRWTGLDVALLARIDAFELAAAAVHRARAEALGPTRPRARRIHEAAALRYGKGDPLAPATQLMEVPPLASSPIAVVTVTTSFGTEAPDACRELAQSLRALSFQMQERRVQIRIELASCEHAERTSSESESYTYDLKVDYEETELKEVPVCHTEQYYLAPNGYECHPVHNPCDWELTRKQIPSTKEVCTGKTKVPTTVKRTRTESMPAQRTIVSTATDAAVTGTWSVSEDGRERSEPIAVKVSGRTIAVEGERLPGEHTGLTGQPLVLTKPRYVRSSDMQFGAVHAISTQLWHEIRAAICQPAERCDASPPHPRDQARADAAKAAAAGMIDDEEEAVARFVLWTADAQPGVFATRYGLTSDDIRRAFGEVRPFTPQLLGTLEPIRTFRIPPRP